MTLAFLNLEESERRAREPVAARKEEEEEKKKTLWGGLQGMKL